MYEDIYELNDNEPELFRSPGIRHDIYFRSYDNRMFFTIWLPHTPNLYHRFQFNFVRASVGTDSFWVKDIIHKVDGGEYRVSMTVSGEELNKYRELLLDKALFNGLLDYRDIHHKHPFEIDKILWESCRT
jgi:hypothetical protein